MATPDVQPGETVDQFVERSIQVLREEGRTEKEARIISHAAYNRMTRRPDLARGLERETTLDFPEL